MKIGITYDLKDDYIKQGFTKEESAEFDTVETIEAIENAIQKMGHTTERIGNIKMLTEKLVNNKRWDMVFNICEGMYGIGREAQVPAILEAYNIPHVFSDTVTLALTMHKGYTKNIIRDNNIPTANFIVAETEEDMKNISFKFPMFVKPVAEGTSKGVSDKSIVNNEVELAEQIINLNKKFGQPVLVEKYLPGREFTVGILGTGKNARTVGVMEVVIKNSDEVVYSYLNKANYEEEVEYKLAPSDIEKMCTSVAIKAWNTLNCLDGGRVDIKMDEEGVPNFIEVNPLAGLNPSYSDLPIMAKKVGLPYDEMIKMIVESAIVRSFGGGSHE